MREILFRGKRIDNGKWVYGYLVKRPEAAQWGDHGGPWYIDVPPADPDNSYKSYNVAPATVGQYTGLTDKNGKRIFEGDIVKDSWNEIIWAIEYVDCEFLATNIKHEYTDESLAELVEDVPDGFGGVEIVGNIYDNPELWEALK